MPGRLMPRSTSASCSNSVAATRPVAHLASWALDWQEAAASWLSTEKSCSHEGAKEPVGDFVPREAPVRRVGWCSQMCETPSPPAFAQAFPCTLPAQNHTPTMPHSLPPSHLAQLGGVARSCALQQAGGERGDMLQQGIGAALGHPSQRAQHSCHLTGVFRSKVGAQHAQHILQRGQAIQCKGGHPVQGAAAAVQLWRATVHSTPMSAPASLHSRDCNCHCCNTTQRTCWQLTAQST